MKEFFSDLFLGSGAARRIYAAVKDLPIIDYHCHLDIRKIRDDASFKDIGELWLAEDHYKWRAMRLCGADESFITGGRSFREKFMKYAEILPKLAGNPLYYWTHMELDQIFGIREPLNAKSAARIYDRANEVLKDLRVSDLFRKFGVRYVATTDDPCDSLEFHGDYGETLVRPTFRPDKLFSFDGAYLAKLEACAGQKIGTLSDLLEVLERRVRYFAEHGCRISDHGFQDFPAQYAGKEQAEKLFAKRDSLREEEKSALFGFVLTELAKLYKKYGMAMQMHFSVVRNVNPAMYAACGADAGFDVIASAQKPENVIAFFSRIPDADRPETIVYTLNDSDLPALACVTGAFRNVKAGAAWWFNDTVQGIRRNLSVIAEYSALGTNYGMLTDSRSFSSYVRFDFFRRILADYLGGLVEKGEYDAESAEETARNISYYNAKELLRI